MMARFRFCLLVALLPLLGLGACQSKSSIDTAIIIEVTSDLLVPTEINQVHVAGMDPQGNSLYDQTFYLGSGEKQVSFPFRTGLYPQHDTTTLLHIEVEGKLDDVPVIFRSATLPFFKGKQFVLPMPLRAVCAGPPCDLPNTTCRESGSCEPDGVDTSTLPPYVAYQPIPGQDAASRRAEAGPPADVAIVDAGQDRAASDALDGAQDVPVDAEVDAPVKNDSKPETGAGTISGSGTAIATESGTALGTASSSTSGKTGTATETQSGGIGTASGIATATITGILTSTGTGTGASTSVAVTGTQTATGTGSGIQPANRCAGVAATCGSAGNGDCCASLLVPGGTFYRGYDGVDFTDKSYPATVADFYLDKYEVTVGRLRKFVEAGMGTQALPPSSRDGAHLLITGSGWSPNWNSKLAATTADLKTALKCDAAYQTWTDTIGANENRAVNCLNWYTAFAFCAWDGGRLPTEAEWNYAASGGSEQRYYPWSVPPTSSIVDDRHAVYCTGVCYDVQKVGVGAPEGDGKWGHSDLAGNIMEWTLDVFAGFVNPCVNCANVASTGPRVLKGGTFSNPVSYLRSAYRGSPTSYPADSNIKGIGARCARSSP